LSTKTGPRECQQKGYQSPLPFLKSTGGKLRKNHHCKPLHHGGGNGSLNRLLRLNGNGGDALLRKKATYISGTLVAVTQATLLRSGGKAGRLPGIYTAGVTPSGCGVILHSRLCTSREFPFFGAYLSLSFSVEIVTDSKRYEGSSST